VSNCNVKSTCKLKKFLYVVEVFNLCKSIREISNMKEIASNLISENLTNHKKNICYLYGNKKLKLMSALIFRSNLKIDHFTKISNSNLFKLY
jgi:hypothetical protein